MTRAALAGAPERGERCRRGARRGGLLLASLLAAGSAQAQPGAEPHDFDLGLSYRAPRSCPPASTFLDALREHLSAGAGSLRSEVEIVRRPARGDFELRLRLQVAGRTFDKVAHSSSCDTLVRLAALSAGIARTDASGYTVVADRAALPATPEVTVRDALAQHDSIAALPAPLAAAAAAPEADSARATVPSAEPEASTRAFALVALRTAHAMLPELAWGEGAAFGLARGRWSLRLTGLWWGARDEQLSSDGSSPLSLRLDQASLELSPCWRHALTSELRIEGCALLAGHRLHTDQDQAHVFGTLGAAALVSVRLWRGLRLELEGGLQAAWAPPELRVARRVRVYQPEPFQPIAQLALAWEFSAAAPPAPAASPRPAAPDVREAAR